MHLREAIEDERLFRHGGLAMAQRTAVRRSAAQARVERPAKTRPLPAAEAGELTQAAAAAPFLVALDVGYSNLKLLAGERGTTPAVTLLPAGAGPATAMPLHPQTAGGGSRIGQDGLAVQVDGAAWAAGVEPSRLQNWERELHPDYPTTAGYRALMHAALLAAGRARIDMLVTGLPVSQWLDPAQRQALQGRLTGTHTVTPARSVEVAEVQVLPQPAGAYFDFAAAEPEAVAEARVLVVDAGFFSVDWLLFDEGAMRAANSGTSTAAVSLVLEAAADLIRHDHGSRIDRDLLERAVRAGTEAVPLFGRPVALAPYLTEAAKQTSHVALTAIRQTLRGERREVDLVLLAGGGAATYAAATRAAFPRARVAVPDNPVLANVRGFWLQANRAAETPAR
jgi:plasmid segregation protein ParM